MADKVRPGQEIEAKQLNAVIDSISIGRPNATQPFRNTVAGGLVNGGSTYITKAKSQFENLFNVTYGPGNLDPDIYTLQTKSWTGIWAQVADWEQLDLMLYHGTFFPSPVSLFLIDPTAEDAKLIWVIGTTLISKIGKLPICEATHSAGIAVFQVFNSSSGGGQDAYNGSCCIVIGDFTKFGTDQGWRPDFGGEDNFSSYLAAIKACDGSGQFFGNKDEIALRFSSPLYVQKSDLEDKQLARPVTYSVGQQHIESIPDSNNSAKSIGKDVYLSSIEFTPATQFNTYNQTPTWSYSLYNFHRKSTDINEMELSDYANYDILLRHKGDHPHETDITKNNCSAVLEYANYGNLVGTVDSKVDPIHLSSVQEATWTYPGTDTPIKYHQLYDFSSGLLQEFEVSDSIDVVVRDSETTDGIGAKVNYIQLSSLAKKIGDVENDTEVIISQKSIERTRHRPPGQQQQVPLNQLYNFDDPASINDRTFRVTLTYDGAPRYFRADGGDSSYSDASNLLLAKHDAGNGNVLEYDNIVVVAPPVNAYTDIINLSNAISDIIIDIPISVDIAAISAQLSDVFWIQGDRHSKTCWGSSIGDSVKNKVVDLDAGTLNWGGQARVDWGTGILKYFGGATAVNWDGSTLNNINGEATVDWKNMHLINSLKKTTVDWENCKLNDSQGSDSIKWEDREALNTAGSVAIDWEDCYMADSAGNNAIDWEDRLLYDKAQGSSIDWDTRIMSDSNGNTTLDWSSGQLNVPGTGVTSLDWKDGELYKPGTGALSLNWRVGYAKDPDGSGCTINWRTGQLWSDDNTRVLNWKLKQLIGGWTSTGNLTISNGSLTISNGSLTIGNTTLSESQLQQLLALLNTP